MTTIDPTTSVSLAPARLGPVAPADREFNLDMLRGWAILGILAVNAMTFAWPFALEMSPDLTPFAMAGADKVGSWATDVFFTDKFRSLFSMLFGVSVFLIGGERSDEARGALLRRRLWLLALIGALHGAVLWFGDILLNYAVWGFVMLLVRSWTGRRLVWTGGLLLVFWSVLAVGMVYLTAWGETYAAAQGAEAAQSGNPFAVTAQEFQAQIEAGRAGWPEAGIQNFRNWLFTAPFMIIIFGPVTLSLMMLGLGLYKTGFFSGRAPVWVYGLLSVVAVANLAVFAWSEWISLGSPKGQDPAGLIDEVAACFAPLITLGYASLLILMTRFGLKAMTSVLVPVGRMAFTNYLTQSFIMASLFYLNWGPHWYGTMGPGALWGVVAAVWAVQLIWSPLWLSRFQMGPLEWLWRSATYGRWVPIRKG
jgi:uncharacterized protein